MFNDFGYKWQFFETIFCQKKVWKKLSIELGEKIIWENLQKYNCFGDSSFYRQRRQTVVTLLSSIRLLISNNK